MLCCILGASIAALAAALMRARTLAVVGVASLVLTAIAFGASGHHAAHARDAAKFETLVARLLCGERRPATVAALGPVEQNAY